MAIDSLNKIIAATPLDTYFNKQITVADSARKLLSTFIFDGLPRSGAAPASVSGSTCSNTTDGSFPLMSISGAEKLYASNLNASFVNGSFGFMMYDRLVHTDSLNSTIATSQTINTTALPARASTGEHVEGFVEFYSAAGATSRTVTVNYIDWNNQNRVSIFTIDGPHTRGAIYPIPDPYGGIKSITNLTLSGTTGASGNFGVTLAKRVFCVSSPGENEIISADPFDLAFPEVHQNACLFAIIAIGTTLSEQQDMNGLFRLIKG